MVQPLGFLGSTLRRRRVKHDAGDCPAPLARLYAINAAPRSRPLSSIIESLVRGSRFLDRSLRRLLHARGLSRSANGSGPDFPTPAARSECGAAAALSALAARGSRTTFIEYAYRRRLLHALGAAPFTDRGTRIAHTRSREHHHLHARRRGHATCRRRARKMK